jgi:hypothetical protein
MQRPLPEKIFIRSRVADEVDYLLVFKVIIYFLGLRCYILLDISIITKIIIAFSFYFTKTTYIFNR